jgi:hypothetical protein
MNLPNYDLNPRDLLVAQMIDRYWILMGRSPSREELASELGHSVVEIEPHLSRLYRLGVIDLEPLALKFSFIPAGQLCD